MIRATGKREPRAGAMRTVFWVATCVVGLAMCAAGAAT